MNVRGVTGGAALLILLAAGQADAAWNNAFQVCCHGSRNPATAYYAPPVVAYSSPAISYSAPSPCCSTSYVQRCYYQPVVSYKTVMQPVTSYRTSYYYEPVCAYRSSCYYDPCSGQSIQVTQPVTAYRLRSHCNAVTSYVQRCVPVTSYRPTYYLEAVNNCCQAPPTPCCGAGAPAVPAAPGGVIETPGAAGTPNIPRQNVPMNIEETPGTPNSFRPQPASPSFKPAPVPPGFDRITAAPSNSGALIAGRVVANNYVTPLRGAKLLFVSRQSEASKQAAQADGYGRFNVNLPEGAWNIYVSRPDGKLEYHSSIDVQNAHNRNVMVVSR
jgi:hypothetical protein